MRAQIILSGSKQEAWINFIIRFRMPIAIGYIFLIFILESVEHFSQGFPGSLKPIVLFELIFLGFVVPIIFLVSIRFLDNILSFQKQHQNEAQIENKLLHLLSTKLEENEFCQSIVTFLETQFPPTQAEIILLFMQNDPSNGLKFDQMAHQLLGTTCSSLPYVCDNLPPDQLPNSIIELDGSAHDSKHRYCLPLCSDNHLIGVIVLDLPSDRSYLPTEILFLKRISSIIIQKILQMQLMLQLNSINLRYEEELNHISQNLHDTLGQSIGFIRLKMEQIRHDFPARRFPEISQELDRVQGVTEEAYQQVRGLLAELHPNSALDLTTALSTQASIQAQRAGFAFTLKETGRSHQLPPLVKRQLLYIFREALNNIEKHAHACQVELNIDWGETTCKLTLKDNGIGFTPTAIPLPDHYGLVIMQERAQDISARFILESSPGNGTDITLILPVSHSPP